MRYDEIAGRDRTAFDATLRELIVMSGLDEREHATVIGVTSPGAGEGKTTIALGLATVLARDYRGSVLLADGNLESPALARLFGIRDGGGFADLLVGDRSAEQAEQAEYRMFNNALSILTAGSRRIDPGRAVRSDLLYEVFGRLRLRHRYVVLDLPPVLTSMTAPVLARRCDGVVLVARHGRTTAGEIGRARALLKDSNVAGVVLNRHRSAVPGIVRRAVGLAG